MAKGKSIGTTHVSILAITSEFEKKIAQAGKTLSKLGQSAVDMGKTLSMRVTAPLTALGTLSVMAFSRQENAVRGLETALAMLGGNVAEQSARMQAFARELQQITTYGDEATLEIMRLGLNLGISTDKIEDATKGAMGLSAAFGMDVNTAMRATALAMEGNFTQLSRYIPELRTATTDAERMAIVQRAMATGFAQAQTEANTLSGSVQRMRNSVGDLAEVIGEQIAPFIVAFSNRIRELAERLQNTNPEIIRMGVLIGGLVASLGPLLIAFGTLLKMLPVVTTFLMGPWTLALAGAIAAFLMFTDEGQKFLGFFAGPKLAKSVRTFGTTLAAEAARFGYRLLDGIINAGKYIGAAIGGALTYVGESFARLLLVSVARVRAVLLDAVATFHEFNPFSSVETYAAALSAADQAHRQARDTSRLLADGARGFFETISDSIAAIEHSDIAGSLDPIISRWEDAANAHTSAIAAASEAAPSAIDRVNELFDGLVVEQGEIEMPDFSSMGAGLAAEVNQATGSMSRAADRTLLAGKVVTETGHDLLRIANRVGKEMGKGIRFELEDVGGGERRLRQYIDGFKGELFTEEQIRARLNDEKAQSGGASSEGGESGSGSNPLGRMLQELTSIRQTMDSLKSALN